MKKVQMQEFLFSKSVDANILSWSLMMILREEMFPIIFLLLIDLWSI